MPKAIISFANSNGNYLKGLARLGESLRNNFDGQFLAFVGEESVGAEPHYENPYNFKIHCIQKAIDAGYKQVLWLDSSCFAIKNVQPIFDEIEKDGFIFQEAGHSLGTWINDFTLNYFDLSRSEAMGILTIGNAGFLGFNFDNPKAVDFFNQWKEAMLVGCFKGNWSNDEKTESLSPECKGHRHDLSCSSALVYKMGLTSLMKAGDKWLQYAGPYDETANDTIIIKAQGC